jgi:hypothetical protein
LGILNELYFDQLVFVGYNNWRHQHGSLGKTTADISMVPWAKKLVTYECFLGQKNWRHMHVLLVIKIKDS